MCKECLEIFQEFQTIKRPEGSVLTSDPSSANSKPAPTSASSSSSAAPASSSGVATKMRSVSGSFQKNVAVAGEGGGSGAGVGGNGGGGGGSGGGGEAGAIRRTGSGNHARVVTRQSVATVLSPHMSWDDASLGRSQDDPPSGLARMDFGFDNPTSLRPKESFESLHERDERLMALNEVHMYAPTCVCSYVVSDEFLCCTELGVCLCLVLHTLCPGLLSCPWYIA